MKRRVLVAIMGGSLGVVTLVAIPETRHQPTPPTEAEVVAKLPADVRVLLAGGLCDNIQAGFMVEVQRFPMTPQVNRPAVLERIEYYREWLRRKGCG